MAHKAFVMVTLCGIGALVAFVGMGIVFAGACDTFHLYPASIQIDVFQEDSVWDGATCNLNLYGTADENYKAVVWDGDFDSTVSQIRIQDHNYYRDPYSNSDDPVSLSFVQCPKQFCVYIWQTSSDPSYSVVTIWNDINNNDVIDVDPEEDWFTVPLQAEG
jgi:hypothetical protein